MTCFLFLHHDEKDTRSIAKLVKDKVRIHQSPTLMTKSQIFLVSQKTNTHLCQLKQVLIYGKLNSPGSSESTMQLIFGYMLTILIYVSWVLDRQAYVLHYSTLCWVNILPSLKNYWKVSGRITYMITIGFVIECKAIISIQAQKQIAIIKYEETSYVSL